MNVQPRELNWSAPEPLYQQLADIFRRRIVSGFWPQHHRLLSEPELAREFKVARGTLRAAIAELVKEGLIIQVQGRGTFVRRSQAGRQTPLLSLGELLERSGVTFHTTLIDAEIIADHEHYGDILGPGPYFCIRRVRSIREGPVTVMENVLALSICAGIENLDIEKGSLYRILEEKLHLEIGSASRTFSSKAAEAEIAQALDLAGGAPVLEIDQITRLKDDRPFEFAQAWIRTDRHQLVADFIRL